jgi:hypothetical protein
MEPVSARFEKFEPVHRVSGKIFFETGLQTGLSEPGHSPTYVRGFPSFFQLFSGRYRKALLYLVLPPSMKK